MKGNLHNDKIDALIVGAGPAGRLYAAILASAGKKVLVLEQGPARTIGGSDFMAFLGAAAEAE